MSLPKIEERTLYPPIISHLQNIGFKAVGETKVVKKHPDILFQVDSLSFVIEVKIGKPEIGLKAVAQASDYAKKLGTQNIIILIYPEKYRNQVILDPSSVTKVALNEKINALVLTEYWTESLTIEPIKLFSQLKQQILLKKVKVDFKTIVKLIEGYVRDLNAIVYQIKADELITEVVDKLDLFSSIGEIKDKETAKRQVMNLASYLLFNQLLFYHIYKRKSNSKKLPELEEIKSIKDLQRYFDEITDIDYQSIYRVNILAHIPNKEVVVNTLNEVIKAIKLLRAEHITHDLAGRFFHDLIPFEVRKVLAAFYTHPVAAEILAGLTIDSYDETVIDPACGSGTLLVAAYRRKQELYQKLYGYKELRKMHKKFIENDLTGIDIMPFAAHISAINLTMQNIEQNTDTVRIATLDSLESVGLLKTPQFKRKGIKISPYTTSIQLTLQEIYGKPKKVKKKGSVSPEGKGSEFYIKPVDVVIMNPPFSDREKMPPEMREKLKKNSLGEICGHQVNLWGYFLALVDLLLKPGGKIGAVIPINIARGKATEKIRNFLLENYHIEYIVKPVGDIAFSEGSAFRDVLLIAKKRKPKENDVTGIIFFKENKDKIKDDDIKKIWHEIDSLKREKDFKYKGEFFEAYFVSYKDLLERNLSEFLWSSSVDSIQIINKFDKLLKDRSKGKVIKFDTNRVREGFHTSPKGLSEIVFITDPIDKSRIRKSFLIFDKMSDDYLYFKLKGTDTAFRIKKSKVKKSLKTITGLKKIDITDLHDYIITDNFNGSDKIIILSSYENKKKFEWSGVLKRIRGKYTHTTIFRRFNPFSPNTHILSFYSKEKFVPTDATKVFISDDPKESLILSLFLNSVVAFMRLLTSKQETTGQYIDVKEDDLRLFRVLDVKSLSDKEKRDLFKLFEKIKNVEFPSILEQLENRFWARVELDKTIFKILGFTDGEINEWLPKVYDALVEELKAMKKVK